MYGDTYCTDVHIVRKREDHGNELAYIEGGTEGVRGDLGGRGSG